MNFVQTFYLVALFTPLNQMIAFYYLVVYILLTKCRNKCIFSMPVIIDIFNTVCEYSNSVKIAAGPISFVVEL